VWSRGWVGVGEWMVGLSSSFRGLECWRHIRCPHTEVIAIDTTTTATHRWTSGTCGQGVGLVWGNRWQGHPHLSGGLSAGGAFVAHTPKASPSTPPPLPLIGGRVAHTVKGLCQCGGMDGRVVLIFQGARVLEAHLSPTR
jgi:hypothetical protein